MLAFGSGSCHDYPTDEKVISMKYPHLVRLICWSWILAAQGLAASAASAAAPNIIFILSDDHSLQTIGAYRGRLAQFCRQQKVTPNIDQLAAQGGHFINSFCGNSLCSPSRASILTGLHSHANGVTNLDQSLRAGVWTFPESLRDVGYQTAVIGKWHLGKTTPVTDYWRILPGQGDYWHPDFIGPNGREAHTGYATDVITQMSLDWLRQRDIAKPFLLMMLHKAPHRNWVPPPRYYEWLQQVTIPEPATLFDNYEGRTSSARNQKMEIGRDMNLPTDLKVFEAGKWPAEMKRMTTAEKADWLAVFGPRNHAFTNALPTGAALTRWKYQEYMKDYLRCIRAVDDSVGQVLEYLKAQGLEKNTVVIYGSDQGFYNGEHGWFDKRWIYEESIHMPLVVRWPGVVKAGSRFTPLVQNIDYAETFVDIAGGKIPAGLHGRSLVPILKGQIPKDWRQEVYYHYYDPGHEVAPHYGMRSGRYTLAHFYRTQEWELYDLKKDPHQMRSVYFDPGYAETVKQLRAKLTDLSAQYQDTTEGPVLVH